ncbi:GNAT family N-acetyltransferase [Paenibacillus sp. 1011MAR3C5]|uniref:GNAT family N-acetyltransferase n=1 Tax=Paenibacillus sp. 1011MAR3C5 TaxID=1675787 RepID=UPI000E6C19E8|nr:GNAT family N-acetyltransferase [Paenibacillus sp. 1011MAR3C5]RJE90297.1 GNAT family N-acetyltransferase [Paenibacillus sp. 1011MAR3C5]
MNYTLHKATQEDTSFLWDMLFESLYIPEGQKPFNRSILEEPFMAKYVEGWGRSGDVGIIARDENGAAVGSITARLYTEANKGFGYAGDKVPEMGMAIVEKHRGKGLGKQLIERLIEQLRLDGIDRLSLSVDPSNETAVRLYTRYGFKEIGVVGTSITMVAQL